MSVPSLHAHGHMVTWSHGPMVPWSHGPMVPWSPGHTVTWSHVTWSHGHVVPLSHGPVVTWSHGPLVMWSRGHMVPWSIHVRERPGPELLTFPAGRLVEAPGPGPPLLADLGPGLLGGPLDGRLVALLQMEGGMRS